ncbi:snakin-2-like [Rhodamnia argentea]|uniref:Snakin-2-like n=1 Tax=Rhodamnia argentea TaxID=178133 RepID=A0A8B8Q4M4_9MYRT|nr:snakin-2-like [Rhodamnia argentea]
MAIHKLFIASVLVSVLLLQVGQADQMVPNRSGLHLCCADCGGACVARCQRSSRPHLCQRACRTCCARCNCVPPGTSGNLDACPCYANMTTRDDKRKCP